MLIYGIALAAVSVIAFILYGADKSRARRGAWRIPEKVLLGFSFFGGAAALDDPRRFFFPYNRFIHVISARFAARTPLPQ